MDRLTASSEGQTNQKIIEATDEACGILKLATLGEHGLIKEQ